MYVCVGMGKDFFSHTKMRIELLIILSIIHIACQKKIICVHVCEAYIILVVTKQLVQ